MEPITNEQWAEIVNLALTEIKEGFPATIMYELSKLAFEKGLLTEKFVE